MKLFDVLSALLFLGLLVDAVSQEKFISEADCIEWGARCTREPCVTDMVFHGLCAPNVNCCKRDPVPRCTARKGTCVEECRRDHSFLGRCSRKRVCCRPPQHNNGRH
ncbi:helofensin-3 isoform X1 [Anolis carolinensis]|uniref:helofensin-3 isoform X1 n=1 Tax=Anolis carolinensis TaxID=28377 RepID=UPI002F2B793E